jgi:light-regulated signal transduction histidine kinase (bacteriophytochrome)
MEGGACQAPSADSRGGCAQLETANAELRAAAHALAHDLHAPIYAISGFGKALSRSLGADAPEQAQHYLDRILAAASQLDEYVDALLELASVADAPAQLRVVDLSAIARSILADLQRADQQRILVARIQPGLKTIGDHRLLTMVLENLLGNAWKFTSRRKVAEISFLGAPNDSGCTVYSVQDNGAGFDMAYAGKLFRDFQRLHSYAEFPGTGIGLANVLRIVKRHGGDVWAESGPGKGAAFHFMLAAADAADAAA